MDKNKIKQLLRSGNAENQLIALEVGSGALGIPKIQILLELFCYGRKPTQIRAMSNAYYLLGKRIEISISKQGEISHFRLYTQLEWTKKEKHYINTSQWHKIDTSSGLYEFTDTNDKRFKQIIWNFYKRALRNYYKN